MTRFALDTSVLVPALVDWHAEHKVSRAALLESEVVPAHTLVETFSVLTRMPAPHRVRAVEVAAVLGGLPLTVKSFPDARLKPLLTDLAQVGIDGGAVYDALIAATATEHKLTLLTRDRRAVSTYDAVGAAYRFVD